METVAIVYLPFSTPSTNTLTGSEKSLPAMIVHPVQLADFLLLSFLKILEQWENKDNEIILLITLD